MTNGDEALPFISIVIPAKNEEQYIGRCIDSLALLDYPQDRYEIIVVDNGSTDSTCEIVSSYKQVRLIEQCGSISAVRNAGGRAAMGDWIAFLDSDCLVAKDWLRRAFSDIQSDQKIGVVSAVLKLEHEPASSPWIERYWLDYLNSKHQPGVNYVTTISSFCFVVPKHIMAEVDWFNESLETCEDSDLGYRIAQHGYKIIIDADIQTIHLGNAKTMRQFYLRQLWQGGTNLKNFFQHKFEWDELPSIVIPMLYLLSLLALIPGLFVNIPVLLCSVFLLISLPSLKAYLSVRGGSGNSFWGYMVVWSLYLAGRGVGMVYKIRRGSR